MMKSFFKKLAFVMALAMVVSMVAPAGAAYAATEGISYQGTKTIVTEEHIEIDEVVDFAFEGYVGYKKGVTTVAWTTSDPTVAAVDTAGKVTGLDNGEATITVTVGGTWVKTVDVTVGTGKAAEVKPAGDFVVEMVSDHSVRIYTDLKLTVDDLLFYYYEEGLKIEVPLVQSVKLVEEGCYEAKMYDGVLFEDGVTYGFGFGESVSEFDCEFGDIARAELTLDGKVQSTVELNEEDDEDGYVLGVIIYDTYNTDITATAMGNGAYAIYDVSEDEDYKYSTIDLENGLGLAFNEKSAAIVKVSIATVDEETEEEVVLVAPSANVVEGVTPEAYKVILNTTPVYTITQSNVDSIDFSKSTHINKKIAVGDEGYTLLLKLKDNKGKEVATSGKYVTDYNTIDTVTEYAKGTFSFKSTNVGRLYVTNEGELMPNAAGNASVLVYFTPAPVDEDDTPKASLVSVVNVTVDPARKVGKVSVSADKTTLSTKAVNGANVATITVEVRDTLGDKVGVEGTTVTIEPKTAKADLKKADQLPELSAYTATVTGGKAVFTVTATAGTISANAASETFNYEIKVGNNTKTEKVAIKVSSPDGDKVTGTALIFNESAKEIKDGAGVAGIELKVSLAGMSNKVASKLLPIAGPKVKASETVAGSYYYTVTKDNVDITDKATIEVRGGDLYIDITNAKNFTYSEYAGSATEASAYVDLLHGPGTYKVTVVKSEGKTFSSKKASGTYTVANKLPSIDTEVTKINPTHVDTYDVAEVVKNCFKFKVGTVEFDEEEDYEGGNYRISVDANYVADGEVVFVNTVTFYKKSAATGVWINCGTVDVYDYITLVDEE